ncbi:MAG: DUF4982 domain-containing protein, partial [Kiritimatiellae bacterium]|nr:DUF4982 domain-containing protein [Kiritimatiellia bacterium]
AAIKAIAREYEQKKAELGMRAPEMKKGVVFYAVVILALAILGSLVLSVAGKGGPARKSKAAIQARQSLDALALAAGRYRYHVGRYPDSLEALVAITPQIKGWNGPYVKKIVPDPWGGEYVYANNGESEKPALYSKGPDSRAGTTDDLLADAKLFDEPFRDTSWTKGWMPYQLRGYVVAPDAETKAAIEREVRDVLAAEKTPLEGEFFLREGWSFAQVWKETFPASTNPAKRVEHVDKALDDPSLEWRKVRLPHDWAISGPFDPDCPEGHAAKLPWRGVGWYRRSLSLPKEAEGKFVALRFGGVMASPEVYLNGEKVGGWDYGYMGFEVDISSKLKFGESNTLAVRVDTSRHRSRWYPGAGIYRDVKLVVEDMDDRMLYGSLKITAEVASPTGATVRVEYMTPLSSSPVTDEFAIADPVLWDVANPHLYEYKICGKTYRYGIRKAEFTPDDGFRLNGRRLPIRGVDLHSDLGPVGMAFDKGLMRRQLEIMKDMGVNAIRTSHNPPAEELLDLCDEMGFIVWDECFDKWDGTAGLCEEAGREENPDELVCRNLKAFVRRDRNHPCVVTWSIGNEIAPDGAPHPWEGKDQVYSWGTNAERVKLYADAVRSEDPTRPVGMGCCFPEAVGRGDYAALDLTGWNYKERYMAMREKYPEKPVMYSESCACFSSNGYYPAEITANPFDYGAGTDIDGYDRTAPGWGDITDIEWLRLERDAFLCGEFVWSGIDYLGEPTPKVAQSRSSYFGICDLLAFPKDRFHLYRSRWNERKETVHLLPHWNWEGREGEKITVVCYTSGDEAELFLNGESLGRAKKAAVAPRIAGNDDADYFESQKRYRLSWEVPYEEGEIKVIAYRNGHPIGEDSRKTAGKAAAIRLTPEKPALADGELVFVKVEIVDEDGIALPLADNLVEFSLEGPGEIVAAANASHSDLQSFADVGSRRLYFGKAAVVIRRNGGSGDPVKLFASAKGVRKAVVSLPRKILSD